MFLILDLSKKHFVKSIIDLLEDEVHFKYDQRSLHTLGDFFIISWRKKTKLYEPSGFLYESSSKDCLVVFQGYAWDAVNIGKPLDAEAIHNKLLYYNFDIDKIRENIVGEYSVVAVMPNKFYAFSDNLGIENIYLSKEKDLFISNRMSLFKYFNKNHFCFESMVFLPTLGYRFAEDTLYENLNVLPQGAYVKSIEKKIEVIEKPFFFITEDDKSKALLEEGLHVAIKYLENIFKDEETVNLGITGGMDSRLVLALLINSNIKKKIKLFTNGYPNNSDVIVGKEIARKLNIEHVNNIPSTNKAAEHSAKEIFEKIRIHSFQNEGMFGAWDIKANRRSGKRIVLTGLVGELLKGYCKQPFDYTDKPNPDDFIPKQGFIDPLGIIKDSGKINDRLKGRVDFYLSSGCSFNDVPDIFYLKERIPNWLGAARRLDSYSDQNINPLNNDKLIKYSFSLTAKERQACLIHFKALELLSPGLIDIPFAEQKWSSNLSQYGLGKYHDVDPIKSKPHGLGNHSKPWQFFLNDSDKLRKIFIELIINDKSGLEHYISNKKIIELLKEKKFSHKELISIYAYFVILIKANHFEINLKME